MYDPHALAELLLEVGVQVIVKCNVTTESQPTALVPVQVAVVVDAVYNTPCHKYDPDELTVTVDELGCLIVTFAVTVLSHPVAEAYTCVYDPEAVTVVPHGNV